MRPLLSSLETEYGFAAWDSDGQRIPVGRLIRRFDRRLQQEHACLPALEGGWFLANGGRLYWDAGEHPEYAAPECAGHPKELIAHVRAGHEILARLAEGLEEDARVATTRVWRANVDYETGQSWGCHENHLVQRGADALTPGLLPHLVSRVIYGGAGGFSLRDKTRFSLSPRLELFTETVTYDTMAVRGIINSRAEHHASRFKRLHLICRDNLVSELADLLSIGMTRLVVSLFDRGLIPDQTLVLDDPIRALHQFCADRTCRSSVRTSRGRMRALDIQRFYLEAIRNHEDVLPDWAEEIAACCDRVLTALAAEPLDLAGVLDWPTKLSLFESSWASTGELLVQDLLLSELRSPMDVLLRNRGGGGLIEAEELDAAIRAGPVSTRAGIRGEVVARLSGRENVLSHWSTVRDGDEWLDLGDPFVTEERWRHRPREPEIDYAELEIPAFLRRRRRADRESG